MTLQELITKVDTLKPNPYGNEDKTDWVNTVEGIVADKVFRKSEEYKDLVLAPYSYELDTDTELLVPSPYCDLYVKYLMAQIDFYNAEYTNYNNVAAMYNSAYDDFSVYFRDVHMPKIGATITGF